MHPHSTKIEIMVEGAFVEASGLVLHFQVAPSIRTRDLTYPHATEVVISDRLTEKCKHPALQCSVCFSPAGMSPEVFILLISLN